MSIDLNCDMGEIPAYLADGTEEKLMQQISSANIACGGHAGDEGSMEAVLRLAAKNGVAAGAHVSYPDRVNFGRRQMALSNEQLEDTVRSQIQALAAIAKKCGVRLRHVKPHGTLYHAAQNDRAVAEALARAVLSCDKELVLVGQARTSVLDVWSGMGCRTLAEAFADRVYERDGTLRSRALAGALIEDAAAAAAQALLIARDHRVVAGDGKQLEITAGTLCIHSDTPGAVENARAVRRALEQAGITVSA